MRALKPIQLRESSRAVMRSVAETGRDGRPRSKRWYSHRERQRVRIILSLDGGSNISQTAKSVQCSRLTVKLWRTRWLQGGQNALDLRERPRSGNPFFKTSAHPLKLRSLSLSERKARLDNVLRAKAARERRALEDAKRLEARLLKAEQAELEEARLRHEAVLEQKRKYEANMVIARERRRIREEAEAKQEAERMREVEELRRTLKRTSGLVSSYDEEEKERFDADKFRREAFARFQLLGANEHIFKKISEHARWNRWDAETALQEYNNDPESFLESAGI